MKQPSLSSHSISLSRSTSQHFHRSHRRYLISPVDLIGNSPSVSLSVDLTVGASHNRPHRRSLVSPLDLIHTPVSLYLAWFPWWSPSDLSSYLSLSLSLFVVTVCSDLVWSAEIGCWLIISARRLVPGCRRLVPGGLRFYVDWNLMIVDRCKM